MTPRPTIPTFTPHENDPEASIAVITQILRAHFLTPEQIRANGGWGDRHGPVRNIIRTVLEELGVNGLGGCRLCYS